LTSGGAIADNTDYRVVLEPSQTFIGTVNEDFAVESMAGDIFQLGNASWRILGINSGVVRVEDAQGQPPGIPFWLGEVPGGYAAVCRSICRFRDDVERRIEILTEQSSTNGNEPADLRPSLAQWVETETRLSNAGSTQLGDYFDATFRALGV